MAIHWAFMQSYMEGQTVHMKMEVKMVDILKNLDPKLYRKYITIEKGRLVIYVELKKAIYCYTTGLHV